MTINFSQRALKNKRLGSLIELCNNDCGAWVYYDLETKTIRNAEVHKKDTLHWETCSTLKHAFKIASSLNWFPSYSFLKEARQFIFDAKQMYERANIMRKMALHLEANLDARDQINRDSKTEWDDEKKKKTQEKRDKRNKSSFGFEGFAR